MKKTLFFLCIFFLSTGFAFAQRKTIVVGPNEKVKSILEAVANAAEFDTIRVKHAVYREGNISLNKPVVLIGENLPVLDGQKKYEVISVRSDNVVIKGFKIERCGLSSLDDIAGVKIYKRQHVTVQDNVLEDNFFGIYFQAAKNCIAKNNKITAYGKGEQEIGNGVHAWKCDSLQIIANTITGHRDGIYLEFVTHSLMWRNISVKNIRYGLHFMFSNNDTYITNIFDNNGSGVAVMYSHHVKMFNNYFQNNWGEAAYGLLLKEITDSHIEGNHFNNNTSGIDMDGASRIEVLKNVFSANGWAMQIQANCMDVSVQRNNFLGNTFDVGTNGTLVLNSFKYNYWDKYEGYDLNRDKIGDIPYRPVSMFSMIVVQNPTTMVLFRSFMVTLLDKTEKILPSLTPENLKDEFPLMKQLPL